MIRRVLQFGVLLLFSVGISHAQTTPYYTIQQSQEIDNYENIVLGIATKGFEKIGDYPFINIDSSAQYLQRRSPDGKVLQDYRLDNLDTSRRYFKFGWIQSLSMFALDSSNLYVYGTEMGYGFFPYMFITTDGSKSWQPILFTTDDMRIGRMDLSMEKGTVHMYSEQEGIIMQVVRFRDTYELVVLRTEDGWKTYKERRHEIKGLAFSRLRKFTYNVYADGVIEVTNDRNPINLIFQSTDHGKSFNPLMVETVE